MTAECIMPIPRCGTTQNVAGTWKPIGAVAAALVAKAEG